MIKIDSILSSVGNKSDAIGSLFRIVNIGGGKLQTGDTFVLTIPKVIEGKVTLQINGQTITLENFPKSLQDKAMTMQIVKYGKQTALEIISTGKETLKHKGLDSLTSKKGNPSSLIAAEQKQVLLTRSSKKKNPLISKINVSTTQNSTAITQGAKTASSKQLTAPRTAFLMEESMILPNQQKKINVIVTQASGKKATLTIAPDSKFTSLKPHITASKTAHAVAQTEQPDKLITTKTKPLTLKIEGLSSPLKKGEYLSLEISPKSQKTHSITLKNIESIIEKPIFSRKPAIPMVNILSQKHQFNAKIEQRLPSGNITFNWQGQSFETNAPKHVQIGDTLLLKVDHTGKKPHIAVLDIVQNLPEKAISLFRSSIAQSEPMTQVLKKLIQLNSSERTTLPASTQLTALTTLLENFTITSDKPLDGTRLMSLIRDSGLVHEALLGKFLSSPETLIKQTHQLNLKTALLDVEEAAHTAKVTQKSTAIKQTAEQGVHRIESQQALNLLTFQQTEPIRLELPMILQGQLSMVQIAITTQFDRHEETQENESSSNSFNILFSLDLSSLGSIRIDAKITNTSVYAGFFTENDQANHFIQKNISRLSDRLEANGFKEIHLSTASHKQISSEKTKQFARLEAGLPISRGLLDVTG